MISVCMAAYNGEKFIREQISSILPQLSMEDELIIFDDCSVDDTIDIIRSFNNTNIRVYKNESNSGVVKTFENALNVANGDYIFLCDQDDIWLPNKISVCLQQLQKYNLINTNCIIVDNDLNVLSSSLFKILNSQKGFLKNFTKNTYQGCCMCFDRKVLRLVLPFPKSIPMHDIWIGFVADLFFKVKFEPTELLLYRRHSGTTTSSEVGKSKVGFVQKVSYRLNLIRYIPLLLKRQLRIKIT